MSELTRRHDPNAQQETWLIHYGDVRVGVIAERVGNPDSTPGWQWSCGFYPGSHPRECTTEPRGDRRLSFQLVLSPATPFDYACVSEVARRSL